MTVFASPHAGFTALSWEPPEGWERLEVKSHPGRDRLNFISMAHLRDDVCFRVDVLNLGMWRLKIQAKMDRANSAIVHTCGRLITRPGNGFHHYWGMFYFDKRRGGEIAVPPETAVLLRA